MAIITMKITDATQKVWNNVGIKRERDNACGSWENHWEIFAKKEFPQEKFPEKCCCQGCDKDVIKSVTHIFNSNENRKEWIVVLCGDCKEKTEAFALKEDTILVNANPKETCEDLRAKAISHFDPQRK